ncbi:NAD(P)-dependent oxidoreductase [uncultured Jatrophihabitans sp.]|uniref:NAD(P)-dependent oxidoreductase n=1 Tax=uncultured Jatrophihabitans sp. TaxID=1610747 RepID=UPI0035CB7197
MCDVIVVGAGRMGLPVATRLVTGAVEVGVLDVRPELQQATRSAGLSWLGDGRDPTARASLEQVSAVVTVLPGSPELSDVMLGSADVTGLLGRLPPGTLWVDMTSAAPDLAIELTAAAARAEVRYVDAAVGGGPVDAALGTLTLYVGGADDDVAPARQLLREVTRPPGAFRHLGGHGAGYLAKLLINQLWFTQVTAVAEVFALAERLGLDAHRFLPALEQSSAASAFVTEHAQRLLDHDHEHLATFGLDRIVEELDSLGRSAASTNTPWSTGNAVRNVHRDAFAHYGAIDGELLAAAYIAYLAEHRPE